MKKSLLLLLISSSALHAQLTTVTASRIMIGSNQVTNGQITFTGTNSLGIAIPLIVQGVGVFGPQPIQCLITSGAIAASCQVPDLGVATPSDARYTIQVMDSGSGKSFSLQSVTGVTGTTWALDQYVQPSANMLSQTFAAASGAGLPPSVCDPPAFYSRTVNGGMLYQCIPTGHGRGHFVTVGGSGSGAPGTAATVTVGSVATLPEGSAVSVVNSGNPTAAKLDFGIPKGATGPQGPVGPVGPQGPAGTGTGGGANPVGATKEIQSNGGSNAFGSTGIFADGINSAQTALPMNFSLTDTRQVAAGYFTDFTGNIHRQNTTKTGSTNAQTLVGRYFAPGYNVGTSATVYNGWNTDKMLNFDMYTASPGINQLIGGGMWGNTIGDEALIYLYWDVYGGFFDGSGETDTGIVINGAQTNQIYKGSVASSTASTLGLTCSQKCDTMHGGPAPGGGLIDTTAVAASGSIVADDTANKIITVASALPSAILPNALGTVVSTVSVAPNGQTGTAATVAVNTTSGTFIANKEVSFACDDFLQTIPASSVSISGSTATFSGDLFRYTVPQGCRVFQSPQFSVDLTADQRVAVAFGHLFRTDYPAFPIDATHIFYRVYVGGGQATDFHPLVHSFATGSTTNGFNLWKRVEILSQTPTPVDANGNIFYASAITTSVMTNPWPVGHTVENPPPASVKVDLFNWYADYNNPTLPGNPNRGFHIAAKGVGLGPGYIPFFFENLNPEASLTPNGGTLPVPQAIVAATGSFYDGLEMEAPAGAGMYLKRPQIGFNMFNCIYNVFRAETTGLDNLATVNTCGSSPVYTWGIGGLNVNAVSGDTFHAGIVSGNSNTYGGSILSYGSNVESLNGGQAGAYGVGDQFGQNHSRFGTDGIGTTDTTVRGDTFIEAEEDEYLTGTGAFFPSIRVRQRSSQINSGTPVDALVIDGNHLVHTPFGSAVDGEDSFSITIAAGSTSGTHTFTGSYSQHPFCNSPGVVGPATLVSQSYSSPSANHWTITAMLPSAASASTELDFSKCSFRP